MSASQPTPQDEQPSTAQPRVAVVGAIHVDLVVRAEQLPGPGDTVIGSDLVSLGGGKGANAALAARRNGAAVSLLGAVGADEHAAVALADLQDAGVDTDLVQRVDGQRTGTALIVVDGKGQNQIAVAPGAGAVLSGADITAQLKGLLANVDCVLVSTEVAVEAVAAAVQTTTAAGVTCLLNCAPPSAEILALLSHGPILSPNHRELLDLERIMNSAGCSAGDEAAEPGDLVAIAQRLVSRTGSAVVVTLGGDGALLVEADGSVHHLPAPQVNVVDTTGAGDTFNGVLAARLAAGIGLLDAVRLAITAASMSVRQPGARAGMPTAAAVQLVVEKTSCPDLV